jgi:hypothetical protein
MRFRWKRKPSAESVATDHGSRSARFNSAALLEPEPASLDELVSEGVMLAEFAGRLRLKNQIIIGALGDRRSYDVEHYAESARTVLSEIIRASEESAALAASALEGATGRSGTGQHQHDYRDEDISNLRLRQKVHTAVAVRLTELLDDHEYLTRFVEQARDAAWGDVGGAITARLDRQWPALDVGAAADSPTARESQRQRRQQLRQLRREIAQLEREHR